MLLAIDAGNTNTLFAVFEGDNLRGQWRMSTDRSRTADEYVVSLTQLFALAGIDTNEINDVIIASVVPQVLMHLSQYCERDLHLEPLIIGSRVLTLGLDIRVDDPSSVGADRLVNAVAAHKQYSGALIVVDFGTATTLDVVAEDGAYEGGVIAPGINLSTQALHMAAAQLPAISIEPTQAVIGKDTVHAMKSGIYWGYVGLIEGLVARVKAELDRPCTVIATGGLAALFKSASGAFDHIEPDLTILGLLEIYKRNRPSANASIH